VKLTGGGVTKDQYGMTIVYLNNLGYRDEPFVLAEHDAADQETSHSYLNMSSDGIEQPEDDAADQETNVYILTTILYLNHICNEIHKTMTIYLYF
jgi:hypothetical protein